MIDAFLVLNAGSSSIKFALYSFTNKNARNVLSGKIVNIGLQPSFKASNADGHDFSNENLPEFDISVRHEKLTQWLFEWIDRHDDGYNIKGVGHRVVHGGRDFVEPVRLTLEVAEQLKGFIPLAPLHQAHNLSAIEAIFKATPNLPQVACFDTSFHRTQSPIAQMFALPRTLTDSGIIRYGFHGLSYQYIAQCLPEYLGELANGRVIVAHLGNGASMCALKHRQSMASSMGFTALDGLMMGQRCGALDAGVVIHLLRQLNMSIDEVEHLLYKESGLIGVSGISNNMQVLLQSGDPHAKQAVDLFCYRAAQELAALVTAINGLDAIVFTAGIGENAMQVRQQICDHLAWLGVTLDVAANEANKAIISDPKSKVKVLVIPTNEEVVIARATQAIIDKVN